MYLLECATIKEEMIWQFFNRARQSNELQTRTIHESTDCRGEIALCFIILRKLHRRQPAVITEDVFSNQCHGRRSEGDFCQIRAMREGIAIDGNLIARNSYLLQIGAPVERMVFNGGNRVAVTIVRDGSRNGNAAGYIVCIAGCAIRHFGQYSCTAHVNT